MHENLFTVEKYLRYCKISTTKIQYQTILIKMETKKEKYYN